MSSPIDPKQWRGKVVSYRAGIALTLIAFYSGFIVGAHTSTEAEFKKAQTSLTKATRAYADEANAHYIDNVENQRKIADLRATVAIYQAGDVVCTIKGEPVK